MKNELKVKQSGITLIALIITIIVLLILAGVTISTLTGENGLLNKAGNVKEQMAMAEEKERLELIKATVAIDNNGEVALDKYIEELIKEGITTKEEVTDNEDGSKQIITDKGYIVNVKVDEDGNPTVTVEGKADALPVRIVNVQLTTSTSSIKVDVQVLRGDGATYKYYYKTESTEYKLAHEGKDLSYTIDNLEQNVTYTIKVEAINKNGTVYKEAVGITGEIQSAVGILEFGSLEWNNGQAEVTIAKNTEDALKIQYQILDEELNVVKSYQEIASGEKITGLNLGETVQARLWDGTNGGSTASLTVTDTTVPNSATITLSSTTTDTKSSITATVTQSDSQSGVNITSCKWVYNTTSGNIGTNASSYPNTFSTTPQTLTLSSTTKGTYYLHVLTIDKEGNKQETVSVAVPVEKSVLEYATQSMPIGASIKEGTTEESGIVMVDSKENEWVWIEVPEIVFTTATSSTDHTNIQKDLIAYAKDYRGSYSDTYYSGCGISSSTEYTTLYNKMLSSVYTNKGFYISRYEIGDSESTESNTTRTSSTGVTNHTPVSKVDQIPYNYVTCSEAQTLSSSMATGEKTSSLLFGLQWDLVCKFLEVNGIAKADINSDSTSWGNYSNILLTTGALEYTNKMNIYDFAGNEYEWTLEYASISYPCSYRGGYYGGGDKTPASYRNKVSKTYSDDHFGFRASLY